MKWRNHLIVFHFIEKNNNPQFKPYIVLSKFKIKLNIKCPCFLSATIVFRLYRTWVVNYPEVAHLYHGTVCFFDRFLVWVLHKLSLQAFCAVRIVSCLVRWVSFMKLLRNQKCVFSPMFKKSNIAKRWIFSPSPV